MKKYDKFIELLLKYNKTHKLTGARTKKDVQSLIKDSLYPFDRFKDVKKVLDIGTGAGFPGMILAIEYPTIEFFLVEPLQKRVAFLYLVKSYYGIKNVTIINERVEKVNPFRVDLITSKAVTNADLIIKLSQNFLYKGLKILLYKGKKVYKEVENLENYEIIQNQESNYLIVRI